MESPWRTRKPSGEARPRGVSIATCAAQKRRLGSKRLVVEIKPRPPCCYSDVYCEAISFLSILRVSKRSNAINRTNGSR
jgi:hypothetical protein